MIQWDIHYWELGAFTCHFVGKHGWAWHHIAPFTSLHKKFCHWRLIWLSNGKNIEGGWKFPLGEHGLQIKAKQPLFYCEGVKHDTYVTRSGLNPIPKYLLDYVKGILNLFNLFTKQDHKHFRVGVVWKWWT